MPFSSVLSLFREPKYAPKNDWQGALGLSALTRFEVIVVISSIKWRKRLAEIPVQVAQARLHPELCAYLSCAGCFER